MGGVGSARRSARAVRDQHGRLLDLESPEDLQQMTVTWRKQRLGEAASRASRGVNVGAEIAEFVAFGEACRSAVVRAWDGREIGLVLLDFG